MFCDFFFKYGNYLTMANNILSSALILRNKWPGLYDIKAETTKENHKENKSEAITCNGKSYTQIDEVYWCLEQMKVEPYNEKNQTTLKKLVLPLPSKISVQI